MSDEIKNSPEENTVVIPLKEFFVPRIDISRYEKAYINPMWQRSYNTAEVGKKFTNAQLTKMLIDPLSNYSLLQDASNYFWSTSPFYQNIIYYFATLMSYDGIITPDQINVSGVTLENRLINSAKTIKNMHTKTLFPHLILRSLINGEAYFYENVNNANNILIREIPSKYCKLAYVDENGQWRYYVDLSLLNDQVLFELPQEIIDAYLKYKPMSAKKKKEKMPHPELDIEIPNHLYPVSSNGFAIFAHKNFLTHDYPFFASMFVDINTMEDNKGYIDEYLKESNIKLIHQKIPTDKESGQPLLDQVFVSAFHESAKEHLPSNTAPLTNPFEVTALNFDGVQTSTINVYENSQKTVQFDSGISSTLFESNTTNGLAYSVEVDASKIYGLTSYLDTYANSKISSQKMRYTLLHIHQHNRLQWHKIYASDMALGGSRMLFWATSGMEIYDAIMIAKMENIINIDQYLPAKMNANQMSGDAGETGRPPVDDKDQADSTAVGKQYTEDGDNDA